MSLSWKAVAGTLRRHIKEEAVLPHEKQHLDEGQQASLAWIAERLPESGLVLADEVGTGKTRIACALIHAVLDAGGRVAVVVPHGLMHQWATESRKLRANSPTPKELTTLTELLRGLSVGNTSPCPGKPEWWLVSHGFRAPLVRNNSRLWRAALPALVEMNLASSKNREDARTHQGKLYQYIKDASPSWWGWAGMAEIAEEVAPHVRGRPHLRRRIGQLPSLGIKHQSNNTLLSHFSDAGDGHQLTEELLGLWLGEFDLIVIDEAHKSRSIENPENPAQNAGSNKILARLLDSLLKPSKDSRRLCLTATPMELDISQWSDLLDRSCSRLDRSVSHKVIKGFRQASTTAAIAPDETQHLVNLEHAAKKFEKSLNHYVTRRRRIKSKEIVAFRDKLIDAKNQQNPHPHRQIMSLKISWEEQLGQQSPWLAILFAAECMSHSARGLKQSAFEQSLQFNQSEDQLSEKKKKRLKHLIRDVYSRVAAGHLNADLFDEDVRIVPPDDCDEITRGKLIRTKYWLSNIQKAMKSGLHEDEHPRILAAVKEIEEWTLNDEKVLVFGVFLRPLRLLRDVLNVRHAIHSADAGRPISHAIHTDEKLLGIAHRQLERLRAQNALSGYLSTGKKSDLSRALASSHKSYEKIRKKVSRKAKMVVDAWQADPALLGGTRIDRKLKSTLEGLLASFVLDDLLAKKSISHDISDDKFLELAGEFVEERLRPLLGELGIDHLEKDETEVHAQILTQLQKDDNGIQSFHARLLQGQTEWQTRRYLQAAFNRPTASPSILIAQSQVGREGLNLHESCRVVIQFHAEWNPAVLEQQIGRVDRKGSLWERRAQEWIDNGALGKPPFIEVRQLIFAGTYDAFQWDRLKQRQHTFDASLFGSLLPADAWEKVPEEFRKRLIEAAPSFDPTEWSRRKR